MNKGKYVFSQVMTYFPRWVFEAAVEKYEASLLTKRNLRELLDVQDPLTQNQNVNELELNF